MGLFKKLLEYEKVDRKLSVFIHNIFIITTFSSFHTPLFSLQYFVFLDSGGIVVHAYYNKLPFDLLSQFFAQM